MHHHGHGLRVVITTIEQNKENMRLLFCLVCTLVLGAAPLDVVIPVHKKDAPNLDIILNAIFEHVEHIGNVYIISCEKFTDRAVWIDEKIFPFSIDEVEKEIGGGCPFQRNNRKGWYYQQLLKFYSSYVIEDISENFLILDADTIPMRKVNFVDDQGKVFLHFTKGGLHKMYYDHMEKFVPQLVVNKEEKINPVVNHMVFSKQIIKDLFEQVEQRFKKPLWQAFLHCVSTKYRPNTVGFTYGASEYLIYYHFCLKRHREKVIPKRIYTNDKVRSISTSHPKGEYDFLTGHILINQNLYN